VACGARGEYLAIERLRALLRWGGLRLLLLLLEVVGLGISLRGGVVVHCWRLMLSLIHGGGRARRGLTRRQRGGVVGRAADGRVRAIGLGPGRREFGRRHRSVDDQLRSSRGGPGA
jgi:hypothetical protein